MQFSSVIRAVDLPKTCQVPVNIETVAMGFGNTVTFGNISMELRYAVLRTMTLDECREHKPPLVLRNTVLYASSIRNQSICQGDSGGPLVTNGGTQIGISSFVDFRNLSFN